MNIGISVSRIGSAAQVPAMKEIAGKMKLELAQFREVEAFATFGSDLDEATQLTVQRGLRLVELFKQAHTFPLEVELQVVLLYSGMSGYLDGIDVNKVGNFKAFLIDFARRSNFLVTFDVNKKINREVMDNFFGIVMQKYQLKN